MFILSILVKSPVITYLLLFVFFTASVSEAQKVETIKLKKDKNAIYFFQKGFKSDSILKNKGDLFFLIVPDSLKALLSLQVENAQIQAGPNDSLVKLVYIKGYKYESLFILKEERYPGDKVQPAYELKTFVNGVSELPANKINISIINKRLKEILLENSFYTKSPD